MKYCMGIINDLFIATIYDELTDIKFLEPSNVTDVIKLFCYRQKCGATGKDSFRATGIYSMRDGSSEIENMSEGVGSSSKYRSSSP